MRESYVRCDHCRVRAQTDTPMGGAIEPIRVFINTDRAVAGASLRSPDGHGDLCDTCKDLLRTHVQNFFLGRDTPS